ncbi:MAG: DUF1592 domain-containing protein, partial [Planctomycetales bacterium]
MRMHAVFLLTFLAAVCSRAGAVETLRLEMKTHCFRCHGGGKGKPKGEVNLVDGFAAKPLGLARDLALLEAVIDALEGGDMPPEDEKQPTKRERERWTSELKNALDAELAKQSVPTPVLMRRMNRFEYNNAARDLFQLTRDPFALPERPARDVGGYFKPATGKMPDVVVVGNRAMGKSQFLGTGNTLPGVAAFPKDNRAEHGFDNRADHLSLSPALMESFFGLSYSIINSPEFPVRCGVWKPLFVPPAGTSRDQQRSESERRLRTFLRRAFRKDADAETVARYHRRFLQRFDAGESFTDSMKATASAVLASPRFLYIYSGAEQDAKSPAAAGGLSDFELASRLSFFLWNSIPDEELLDLASQGKLSDPATLGEQADRMMNDPRIKNFCDSFALQWLQLDQMVSATPDEGRYRSYYFGGATGKVYRVGMHMMLEPLLLFETVFVEDRPIMDLIDPDFTYRSDMLAGWHEQTKGAKGRRRNEVTAIRFHRTSLQDRRWGGVITNAAVLTMTSSPLRTKPIKRGAWLATTIFNDPPAPPPADVPEIEEDDEKLEAKGLTLRETLKQHITN